MWLKIIFQETVLCYCNIVIYIFHFRNLKIFEYILQIIPFLKINLDRYITGMQVKIFVHRIEKMKYLLTRYINVTWLSKSTTCECNVQNRCIKS